jgi:hypothetical protein
VILVRDQRKAIAGLTQLTTSKNADAGLTFLSIPAFRHYLKGQCHKIFAFSFFFMNLFLVDTSGKLPPVLLMPVANNTRGTGGKICHRFCWKPVVQLDLQISM